MTIDTKSADIQTVSRLRLSDVVNNKTAKFAIDMPMEMLSRGGKPDRTPVRP